MRANVNPWAAGASPALTAVDTMADPQASLDCWVSLEIAGGRAVSHVVLVWVGLFCVLAGTACSDLSSNGATCTNGTSMVDGGCPPIGEGTTFFDPPPKSKAIRLACMNNLTTTPFTAAWELTVDPGPIIAGEPFGALFRGVIIVDEFLLDEAQVEPQLTGYKRSNVLNINATVHARRGLAEHGHNGGDVTLTPAHIAWTCTYDQTGNRLGDGPFPSCDPLNDNGDGSNDDCVGGGGPSPENRCGQFTTIPTSDDCRPGGTCEVLNKAGQCFLSGFCVTGPQEVPLEAAVEGYVAASSGSVLFGWDDASTDAVVLDGLGADEGRLQIPQPTFEEPAGPNGWRILVQSPSRIVEAAYECTMATSGSNPRLLDDEDLIAFEIR